MGVSRSMIRVELSFLKDGMVPSIDKIIRLVEGCASSAVYPILKREDEKFVTEKAKHLKHLEHSKERMKKVMERK